MSRSYLVSLGTCAWLLLASSVGAAPLGARSRTSVVGSAAGKVPSPNRSRLRAPGFDPQRRQLLAPRLAPTELRQRLGIVSLTVSGGRGGIVKRGPTSPARQLEVSAAVHEAMNHLLELDPHQQILPAASWKHLTDRYHISIEQRENPEEHIFFALDDPRGLLREVRRAEELARGTVARALADALKHESPSPQRLQQVSSALAAKHPFLANPMKVEMLIADLRRVFPILGKWDFRTDAQGRPYRAPRALPAATQHEVARIGHRAFAGANVLFANHMYQDSLVMIDALQALGLEPGNARFVATPYPFDPRIRRVLEGRGIDTAAEPYSLEKTHARVKTAIEALIARSDQNHGPILVYDDGGVATEVIAKHFAAELYRFRIVEITKAGERIGKALLPPLLQVNPLGHKLLRDGELKQMRAKFLDATSFDGPSRVEAEKRWANIEQIVHRPHLGQIPSERSLPPNVIDFGYYTYSNTAYKRQVMTPLYTQQVNQSMFEAIARGGQPLVNRRVAIIGGGAMGLAAGRELRDQGFEVTFVEHDPARAKLLGGERFAVEPLHSAISGRGIVLELSGVKGLIGANEIFELADGAHVLHGSSKDNPFDMHAINALAEARIARPEHRGQRSASYRFRAAGITKELHFPGDGYTISHGGKPQNVPLASFLPELHSLIRVGVHALTDRPVTHYPIFTAPDHVVNPPAGTP